MGILDKFFKNKKEAEPELFLTNKSVGNNEINTDKKLMSDELIMQECIQIIADDLNTTGYDIVEIADNSMSIPQIQVSKDNVTTYVFIKAEFEPQTPREVFSKEEIMGFNEFSHSKNADTLIAIVCPKSKTTGIDLYFGDEINYTFKYELFPCLNIRF